MVIQHGTPETAMSKAMCKLLLSANMVSFGAGIYMSLAFTPKRISRAGRILLKLPKTQGQSSFVSCDTLAGRLIQVISITTEASISQACTVVNGANVLHGMVPYGVVMQSLSCQQPDAEHQPVRQAAASVLLTVLSCST